MDDWEDVDGEAFVFPPKPSRAKFSSSSSTINAANNTLVLVGRTGNGKSATGNSILGSKKFRSQLSAKSVTTTCESQETTLPDGRTLRVIDTPGLFDVRDPEIIGKELVKCIELAKDGIHGILVVLSVRNRLTPEEIAAVESLQSIFGPKVLDHMIVLFTGGDELEEGMDEYLSDAPEFLKEFVNSCRGRKVLFDNKTKDKKKLEKQRGELLKVLDAMLISNSCVPYTNEYFAEAKKFNQARATEQEDVFEARLSRMEEDIRRKVDESKLAELEKQLAEARERADEERKRFDEALRQHQDKAHAELLAERRKFEQDLRKAQEELRKENSKMEREFQQKYNSNKKCGIL